MSAPSLPFVSIDVESFRSSLPASLRCLDLPTLQNQDDVPPFCLYLASCAADLLPDPPMDLSDLALAGYCFSGMVVCDQTRALGIAGPLHGPLAQVLLVRGSDLLLGQIPAPDPGGRMLDKLREEIDVAIVDSIDAQITLMKGADVDLRFSCQLFAPVRLASLVVALRAGRGDLLPLLRELVGVHINSWMLLSDIGSLHRDLEQGRKTYPIVKLMHETGWQMGDRPEFLLSGLLLTRAIPDVLEESRGLLSNAIDKAKAAGLHAVSQTLSDQCQRVVATAQKVFSPVAQLGRGLAGRRRTVAPASLAMHLPRVRSALTESLLYLAADPDQRESFEHYGFGLYGQRVLTGRLFAPGLITENLHALQSYGFDLARAAIQPLDLVRRYCQGGYCYFAEPSPLPPDADSLGLMLRLCQLLPVQEQKEALDRLGPILHFVARKEGDRLPVWFPDYLSEPMQSEAREALGGEAGARCVGCELHLLVGLAPLCGPQLPQAAGLLERVAQRIFADIPELATALYYGPLYVGFVLRQLLVHLEEGPFFHLSKAGHAALERLMQRELPRTRSSPQEAALLILGVADKNPDRTPWESLLQTILLAQRPDGAWDGEPVYRVPTRGGQSAWHKSRNLTTSLCARALGRYLHLVYPGGSRS